MTDVIDNDGLSVLYPFTFIQQALYTIYTMETTYSEIEVNLYLGKGDHYLFSCADDYNESVDSDYDFCATI